MGDVLHKTEIAFAAYFAELVHLVKDFRITEFNAQVLGSAVHDVVRFVYNQILVAVQEEFSDFMSASRSEWFTTTRLASSWLCAGA